MVDSKSIILLGTCTIDEKYETCHEKVQYIAIQTNISRQFIQKEKKYFWFIYKARRRRRFFGGIFGMRNFGLNSPPLIFFKKVVRRGGELALIPLICRINRNFLSKALIMSLIIDQMFALLECMRINMTGLHCELVTIC